MQTSVTVNIRLLLETLLSPAGMLAVVAGFVLLFVLAINKSAKWVVISVLLWVSTLGVIDVPWLDNTLVFPLEQIRRYGRPIVFALLLLLVLPALTSSRGWRVKLLLGGAIAYFIFQLFFSVRLLLGGLVPRGVAGAIVYMLIFTVFGYGLGCWMQTVREVHAVLWSVAGSGIIFVLGTLYQLLANHSAVVSGNRLLATTGNSQAAALVISVVLPVMCYLLIVRAGTRMARIVLSAAVGCLVLFLIWTGSRTGLLMTLVALGLLFRTRIVRGMGVVLICGIFFLAASLVFSEGTADAGRLISTKDTRTHNWKMLAEEFLSSPLTGIVHDDVDIAEMSYLSIAARCGVAGIGLFAVFGVLAGISIITIQHEKHELGEYALLGDLVTAGLVSLAVGANFEGFLLGTLTNQIFVLYIYLAILAFLLDAIRFNRRSSVQENV